MDHTGNTGDETGKNAKDQRPPCPRCGGTRVVPIRYGYPHFLRDPKQAPPKGQFVLGGCVPRPERWACPACDTRFGEAPETDGTGRPDSTPG
ncbi:transposase-like protein [Streptosporangium becharense]|uniref:Transposase-like protein n=1 Tax=Streptosporangium becharense TaxID=1816182 RepID=A0A7W9MIN9_9ACTN|nr:transposase-like protein [Streptosporangium becharense]MBB5821831.1 transposase-like protein [Streptosporangium becharense]